MKRFISIVTPCYNETDNVEELYTRVAEVMSRLPYSYEHIYIDNNSTDGTVPKLRNLALKDIRVKLIINTRNFGHIRSPYHAILQASGNACICIASDLQDPPEMIETFLEKWEQGFKIVLAVKPKSDESHLKFFLRRIYYRLISKISEVPLVQNTTGAGLYDSSVIEILRRVDDPYPYFRGLLSEIGYPIAEIPFHQPSRKKGLSKNNLYSLYDLAMLGIAKHSKVPLRLMTIAGLAVSCISFLSAGLVLVLKLLYWNSFQLGVAPTLIAIFFFGAVQVFFLGVLGEYVGIILTHVRKLPLVVEAERVNFDSGDPPLDNWQDNDSPDFGRE